MRGRIRPRPAEEQATVAKEREPFIGDVPSVAGASPSQERLSYRIPRNALETLDDIVYTPAGHAWQAGALIVRASIRPPSLPEALRRPTAPQDVAMDEAWLIESETPYTYGDWVGDGIRALVEAPRPAGTLLLPESLAAKPYVRRDLDRLGIAYAVANRPVRVRRAHVLLKQIPYYYWTSNQVEAYRQRFAVPLLDPAPGSLLYLSREGVLSEAIDRGYPSAEVAEIVRRLGGVVFDTSHASPKAFADLARSAETVIADQGSALFGVLQWRTRRVLEITTDAWWHNANLFFARASGVEQYAVLVCDRYDAAPLERRIYELLAALGFSRSATVRPEGLT